MSGPKMRHRPSVAQLVNAGAGAQRIRELANEIRLSHPQLLDALHDLGAGILVEHGAGVAILQLPKYTPQKLSGYIERAKVREIYRANRRARGQQS